MVLSSGYDVSGIANGTDCKSGSEEVTMKAVCKACASPFTIDPQDRAFYENVAPSFAKIAEPRCCPRCRLQRRIAFRNQSTMYVRTSSKSGERMFSVFPDTVHFPVYTPEEWWGDDWDAADYAQELNFDEPFFTQLARLRDRVPHIGKNVINAEGSVYCNNVANAKNSYLCFNSTGIEDCLYLDNAFSSRDCIDCSRTYSSELCYDCVQCTNCYNLIGSRFCAECTDSYFLSNCRGCRNCIGCVNLRRKEYHVFNEPVSRAEFERLVQQLRSGSFELYSEYVKRFEALLLKFPVPHEYSHLAEDVTGNYINESSAVHDSMFVNASEQLRYCFYVGRNLKSCYDVSLWGDSSELLLESAMCGMNCRNLRYCCECWIGSTDLDYCIYCVGAQHCFGCVGMRKKQYCILNKQYTAEQYYETAARLAQHMQRTGEWGEFFPTAMSPIPYNDSLAARYFPLSQSEAAAKGLVWRTAPLVESAGAIPANELPDMFPINGDSIIVKDARGQAFRIVSDEIRRCRALGVPLPRVSYQERMEKRAAILGGIVLYQRQCAKSGKQITTTISPDSPLIVWDREVFEATLG